jgi:uncharacterized RDD family membrane protein YckC
MRAVGYLIDAVPAVLFGLFGLIPLVGPVIVGILATPYWLLRDVTGASLGKRLLRFRVVSKTGGEASVGARVLRNVPLALCTAPLIIPLLGLLIAPPVGFLIALMEGICIFAKGERVGDIIAGTSVVRP